jgi:hypothetical protein
MYSIPEFASSGTSSGTPSSSYVDFSSLGGGSSGGQNQYGSYPSMGSSYPIAATSPSQAQPGVVSPAAPSTPSAYPNINTSVASKQGGYALQGGQDTVPTQDPNLTSEWDTWLQSQIGTGVAPFDLSAILPSSGQATTPGTLTAPENALMQQLNAFYEGQGTGVSGTMTSGGTATGGPLSYVLPMWQSEVSAMNQPIQQQLADIKEQFGSQGALGSSEMATAMANYGAQTAASEESLLGQLTMQALPLEASEAAATQTLDQSAITNLYNEFIRTQPQYNPLISDIQSTANTYPSTYGKAPTFGSSFLTSLGSGLAGDVTG